MAAGIKVKCLTATDLHLRPRLYDNLAQAVEEQKPDLLALIGDFLDGDDPSEVKWARLSIEEAARRIAALKCEVVFVLGNHEPPCWDAFATAWAATGRVLNVLHGSAFIFGPLKIVGFPCLMGGHDFHLQGVPRLFDKHASSWLSTLMFNEGQAALSCWLMHEPPMRELCEEWAFCEDWYRETDRWQPLVTVSGHDHKFPRQTGIFHVVHNRTVSINCGQKIFPVPGPLTYCLLEFEFASSEPSIPKHFSFQRCEVKEADEDPF
jgi:Icc-related predicted phosphoesterase